MDLKKLVEMLHPHERNVLPYLARCATLKTLSKTSDMKEIEVMRALQWLANKKVLKLGEEVQEIIELGKNGQEYAKNGLPERRFLKALTDKAQDINQIAKKANLEKEEINICIGTLKRKVAIDIIKEKGLKIIITAQGKKIAAKESLEEQLLKSLPRDLKELKPEEKFALDQLKSRKEIIILNLIKTKTYQLTDLGKRLVKKKFDTKDFIDRLTPAIIKSGSWKKKTFRRYDIKINVPHIYGGKRHFVKQATDYAKKIWMDMGFREMTGNFVGTSFWNFDALFTAQDHPVREMQDTFFIGDPEKGKLPKDKKLIERVKKAHENGVAGSLGWQYKWDPEEAKRNVLRTHTTILSAKTISTLKEVDLPGKFFALGRCFRNETMDWSHLFEFNQTEGIVIDPDANFRHLLGYLKQFFKLMGFPKARFRPAHFPYTEPSVEIDVFHPTRKKWMELGGAGIFRPEVVVPLLGKDVPVLAWGPGFDRIILEYYKINDIRDLYKNNLKQLKEMRFWLR